MSQVFIGKPRDGKCTSTARQLLKHMCTPHNTSIGHIERLDLLRDIVPDVFAHHDTIKPIGVANVWKRQREIMKTKEHVV
jgi:hypothetical protein